MLWRDAVKCHIPDILCRTFRNSWQLRRITCVVVVEPMTTDPCHGLTGPFRLTLKGAVTGLCCIPESFA